MKKIVIFLTFLGCVSLCDAQDTRVPSTRDTRVLMSINGKPVTVDDFMYVYQKSNQSTTVEKETMDQYLERYINFRLKVEEATSRGMDTTEAFRTELKGYRAQATPKYLRDEEAIDSLVRISYYRMAHLRRAAHIAIECKEGSADSASAFKQIQELRTKAIHDKNKFYELAKTYSSDPTAKENGGELGWITPFRYVYSFEDAIYNTPIGEVTAVFRSPYGYHIALVEEELSTKEVHAAHIMKMAQQGNPQQVERAKLQIDSIYQLLVNGADFAQTARQLSDDKGSATRGGDLGWFGKGVMVKPFEDMAFNMLPGMMSAPFQSQFGWHIIYLYDKRDLLPLDSIRDQVLRNVQRDERIKEAEKSFLCKARREYALDEKMTDEDVMNYVDAHLEEKYPEFKNLVQEYHDGILLFGISMEEVWDKASKDTIGLEKYFNQHRKKYKWTEPRYKGFMVYAADKDAMKRAELIIKNTPKDSVKSYIDQRINNDSTTLVKVAYGIWKKGKKPEVDKYAFRMKNDYKPSEKFPIVKAVGGKVLKSPEHYTDVHNSVANDYQDQMDSVWIQQLRSKYEVVVNQDVFLQLKQTEE